MLRDKILTFVVKSLDVIRVADKDVAPFLILCQNNGGYNGEQALKSISGR